MSNYYYHFTAIIQDNLHYPAPPVKNWWILLQKSFTANISYNSVSLFLIVLMAKQHTLIAFHNQIWQHAA